VKFVFVVILTLSSAGVDMTYARIRRTGNKALASRLAILGPVSGIAAVARGAVRGARLQLRSGARRRSAW
jgi:hypothetical protein